MSFEHEPTVSRARDTAEACLAVLDRHAPKFTGLRLTESDLAALKRQGVRVQFPAGACGVSRKHSVEAKAATSATSRKERASAAAEMFLRHYRTDEALTVRECAAIFEVSDNYVHYWVHVLRKNRRAAA